MNHRLRALLVVVGFLLAATPGSALAQGKIAGRVTDASGAPLIGVNVVLEGTQRGTATNVDGKYVLLNVRPGTQTVKFTYVGFGTKRVENIEVETGRTSRVNVEMNPQAMEGEEVTVRAERPLVRKDLTASRKSVNAEEIESLPVESFLGVLKTQAGVTQGANGALHIRGGRSNEISYLVDGLSVGNPFNTNGLATGVAKDAIQEMTVISGAFNAEYGKAMSGIVNLVTKEGGDTYEGSFSAYGGDTFTTHEDVFNTPGGVNLNEYTLEGTLSGPVPLLNDFSFFFSGRGNVDNGSIYGYRQHLPSDSANFNSSPWYYELHGVPANQLADPDAPGPNGFTLDNLPDSTRQRLAEGGFNERVSMNSSSSYNALGKLTWRPFSGGKITYSFLTDGSQRQPFEFAYLYNPEGAADVRNWSYNNSLHWTHTLSDKMFYEVKASYAQNSYRYNLYENPRDSLYAKDLSSTGSGRVLGFPGNNFVFGGDQKGHVYEDSRSLRFKFDLTRQFGTVHETKIGLDVQRHLLNRENFTVLYDGDRYPEPTVPDLNTPAHDKYGCRDFISEYLEDLPEEELAAKTRSDDECSDQPVFELSAYAQDKIEFEDFIINVGLRYARFDPHGKYIPNLLDPQDSTLAEADPTNLFLPRLGVSFPITDRGIIHFSYGHFAQMPTLRNMYRNPEFEFPKGQIPLFGNTNMRPERTVQYEVGLQQQLGQVLAFDVTGFYKDIRDYLALQRIRYSTIAGEDQYSIYRNKDYANVKGVTFSLTKRRAPEGYLSANLDYTFQVAEGNNDDSDAFFYNFLSSRENEFEVVPLDFDQRHVLSATVTLSQPRSWGLSLIGRYSTGYPYTPLLFNQNIDQLPNSDRKPSQIDLDARLFKTFSLGGVEWRAFAKIYNMLDRLNERYVFDDTGSGKFSLKAERNLHATWRSRYGQPGIHTLNEYDTRPHYFGAPRSVRLGLALNF